MTPVFVGLISEEFLESPKELCAVEDMNLGYQLSDVSNDDLDEYVREILEVTRSAGQRQVEGGLRQRGLRFQRHRIAISTRNMLYQLSFLIFVDFPVKTLTLVL